MEIKAYNGWFHINNNKPNPGEKVIVILERESAGCSYETQICESTYNIGYHGGYFSEENSAWKVTYWRRKEMYPYPNEIVKRKIEECKKNKISFQSIVEYQRQFGIEVD